MTADELAVQLLVVGLVSFRLWRLAALDGIADPARRLLWDRVRPDGTGWAAGLLHWLSCPWCCGFWVAGAVTLAVSQVRGTLSGWEPALIWWGAASLVPLLATVAGDVESDA